MKALRPYLLLIAAISFGLGISLPLIELKKLYVFSERPSLIGVTIGLWTAKDYALAAVVALFSIILPIVKLSVSFQTVFAGRKPKSWTSLVAKWSLMDVLLVAILVFAAKTSGLATAVALPGVWFFGLSTIATALATQGIRN